MIVKDALSSAQWDEIPVQCPDSSRNIVRIKIHLGIALYHSWLWRIPEYKDHNFTSGTSDAHGVFLVLETDDGG